MDSIPFRCIPSVGYGEAHGVARFASTGIDLQYQLHDPVLGVLRPDLHRSEIAIGSVGDIELDHGRLWLKPRILIRLSEMGAVANLPRDDDGRLALKITLRDRGLAAKLVAQTKLYCADSRYAFLQGEIDRLAQHDPGKQP